MWSRCGNGAAVWCSVVGALAAQRQARARRSRSDRVARAGGGVRGGCSGGVAVGRSPRWRVPSPQHARTAHVPLDAVSDAPLAETFDLIGCGRAGRVRRGAGGCIGASEPRSCRCGPPPAPRGSRAVARRGRVRSRRSLRERRRRGARLRASDRSVSEACGRHHVEDLRGAMGGAVACGGRQRTDVVRMYEVAHPSVDVVLGGRGAHPRYSGGTTSGSAPPPPHRSHGVPPAEGLEPMHLRGMAATFGDQGRPMASAHRAFTEPRATRSPAGVTTPPSDAC